MLFIHTVVVIHKWIGGPLHTVLRVQYISRPRRLAAPAYANMRLSEIPYKSDLILQQKNDCKDSIHWQSLLFAPICIKRGGGLASRNAIAHHIAVSRCSLTVQMLMCTRILTLKPDYRFAPQASRRQCKSDWSYGCLVYSCNINDRINIDTHSRFAGNIKINWFWNFP